MGFGPSVRVGCFLMYSVLILWFVTCAERGTSKGWIQWVVKFQRCVLLARRHSTGNSSVKFRSIRVRDRKCLILGRG